MNPYYSSTTASCSSARATATTCPGNQWFRHLERTGESSLGHGNVRFSEFVGTQDSFAKDQSQLFRQALQWGQHAGIPAPKLEAEAWNEIVRECEELVDGYQGEIQGLAQKTSEEKSEFDKILACIPMETTITASPILRSALLRPTAPAKRSTETQTDLAKFHIDIYFQERQKFSAGLREIAVRLQAIVNLIHGLKP